MDHFRFNVMCIFFSLLTHLHCGRAYSSTPLHGISVFNSMILVLISVFNSMLGRLTGNPPPAEKTDDEKLKEFEENFEDLKSRCSVCLPFFSVNILLLSSSFFLVHVCIFQVLKPDHPHLFYLNKWQSDFNVIRCESFQKGEIQ